MSGTDTGERGIARGSKDIQDHEITIGVIMATHNRASTTRRCLEALRRSTPRGVRWQLYVHDDGSVDETVNEIRSIFPSAVVSRGTGKDYWAKSMAIAERGALRETLLDCLFWLNDDVLLTEIGLMNLYETLRSSPGCIAVGVTTDFAGDWTYGGLRKTGRRPLQVSGLGITTSAMKCETFHGNAVMIPIEIAHRLGGIDGGYPHAYADIDYGLRASRAGIHIVQMAGVVGVCDKLPSPALPKGVLTRLGFFNQPKHFPFKAQVRIGWKFGGLRGATVAALGFVRRLVYPGTK